MGTRVWNERWKSCTIHLMHLVLLDQTTDDLVDLHPDQRPNSRYGPLPDLEMGMSQRTTRLQSSRALDPVVGIVNRAEWLLDVDLIGSNADHRTWKASDWSSHGTDVVY
jgi:hypothetical protein